MLSLILCAALAQAATTPALPLLADGIRQVDEGDFEAAVVTLRAAAASLSGDPARAVQRARAELYLGVAHLALDQPAEAHRAFLDALHDDPRLRLTEDRFSPKVIAAFEAARAEGTGPAPPEKKAGSSTPKIVGAAVVGAAVATGAVVLLGGSDEGSLRIVNARFAAALIDCPDNSNALPIAFTVLADVLNEGDAATVLAATIIATITASSEAEVGQASNRPVTFAPAALPAHQTTTVRLDSTLLCSNAAGGPSRSNDWMARVTLTTSTGTITGQTVDTLRVSIP